MGSKLLHVLAFKLLQYYGPLRKGSSIKISMLVFDFLMIFSALFGGVFVRSFYGLSDISARDLTNIVSLTFSGVLAMGIFLGMRGGITALEPEIDFILPSPIKPSTYLLADLLFQFIFLNVAATPPLIAFTMVMIYPRFNYLPIIFLSYEIMLLTSSLIAQLLGVLKSVWNEIAVEALGWIILIILFFPLLSTAIGFPIDYSTIPYPSTILSKYSLESSSFWEGLFGMAYMLIIATSYLLVMKINFLPEVTPLLTTALMEMPSSSRRLVRWSSGGLIQILSPKMDEGRMLLMVKLNLLRILRDGSLFTALILFGIATFSNLSISLLIRQAKFSGLAALTFTILYSPLIPSIFSINWGIVEREALWATAVSEEGLKKYAKGMTISYFITTLLFSAIFYSFLNIIFSGTPFLILDIVMLFSTALFASILSVIVSFTLDKPSNALSLGALLYVFIPLFGAIMLSTPVIMARTNVSIADTPPPAVVMALTLYTILISFLLSKYALDKTSTLFDKTIIEETTPPVDFKTDYGLIFLNLLTLSSTILTSIGLVGCLLEANKFSSIIVTITSVLLLALSVSADIKIRKTSGGGYLMSMPKAPWRGSRVALLLGYVVVFKILLQFFFLIILPIVFLDVFLTMILEELAFITPLAIYFYKKRMSPIFLGIDSQSIVSEFKFTLKMLPIMLLTGVLSGVIVQTLIPLPQWFQNIFNTLAPRSFEDVVNLSAIVIFIVAPCEEILFRGFVQRGLESSLGGVGSIFASSIIFGIFHLNPWQFLPAFTLGLILGYAFRKRGYRIWCPIALHAAYNVSLFVLNYVF
jgi:membrane protease YdiL (CAAX protease family)